MLEDLNAAVRHDRRGVEERRRQRGDAVGESDDRLRHSKFLSVLPKLRDMARQDEAARRGNPISRTGLFVVDTAGNILQSPLRLGAAVLGQ